MCRLALASCCRENKALAPAAIFLSNPEMKKGDTEDMKWTMKKPEKNVFQIRV
jgi:hypothetical protein